MRTRTTTFLQFSRRPLNLERRRKGPSPPLVFGNALAPVKRAPVDADCCVLQKHGGEFAAVLWIGFSTWGVAANRSTLKQTARDLRARKLTVCPQVEHASPEASRHGKSSAQKPRMTATHGQTQTQVHRHTDIESQTQTHGHINAETQRNAHTHRRRRTSTRAQRH